MPDDFFIKFRGAFEGTMKVASCVTKCLLDAMILHADPEGVVTGSVEHWASYLQYPPVPLGEVRASIAFLESPDEASTHTEEEGRRLVRLGPNKWRIVNYLYYKYEATQVRRRSQNRASQARSRARNPVVKESDLDKGFKAPTLVEVREYFRVRGGLPSDAERFHNHHSNANWRLSSGRGPYMKDWKLAANNWMSNRFVNGSKSAKDSYDPVKAAEALRDQFSEVDDDE